MPLKDHLLLPDAVVAHLASLFHKVLLNLPIVQFYHEHVVANLDLSAVWNTLGSNIMISQRRWLVRTPHMVVELVGHYIRWEGDVTGGKNVDLLAAATFREVDCSGALSIQRCL